MAETNMLILHVHVSLKRILQTNAAMFAPRDQLANMVLVHCASNVEANNRPAYEPRCHMTRQDWIILIGS